MGAWGEKEKKRQLERMSEKVIERLVLYRSMSSQLSANVNSAWVIQKEKIRKQERWERRAEEQKDGGERQKEKKKKKKVIEES